ncbi:MAG: TlpA disulfide reductase family protein [Bacteroidota bacterium]
MNLAYILLAFSILLFNGGTKAPSERFTTITVDDLPINKGLNFYYHDSLANGYPVTIASVQKKIILDAPTLLFEANRSQIPFLIYPGEEINIKYAATDSALLYVKGNAERTNELNFFRKLVQETGNVYTGLEASPYHKKTTALSNFYAFEKTINKVKNTRLEFLAAYRKKQPVSNQFAAIAVNSINSVAFTDSLILASNNKILLGETQLEKLVSQKLLTLKKLAYQPYQLYQMACLKLLSITYRGGFSYTINDNKKFESMFNFVVKNFEGKTKDFLLTRAIFSANNATISISKEVLEKYNKQCTNEQFKKFIVDEITGKRERSLLEGKDNLLGTDRKTIATIEEVVSSQKGKLIVLDFWASWCVPCRIETPYLKILKQQYQNKDIVFIAISIDKRVNDWIKAGKEEELEANNFLFLNFDKSLFKNRYKINTIPRYFLIGKDGKIVNDDLARPSDPELKTIIDKLI